VSWTPCTSTQSSNLKWAGGGGINSPRHQTSRWLKAAETSTVGWSDAIFFRVSVHPVLLAVASTAHDFSDTTAPMLCTDGPLDHPVLKTPLPRDRRIDRRFTLTKASDHLVLKALSWRISVWIQTERRIDRRCPHLNRRIIRCYCPRCSSSATRPALLKNGPSVHPKVPRVSPSVPTRPTIAPMLAIMIPSVHPTVCFSFLFFMSSTWIFAST
jgi:hypothetical protein